MSRKFKQIYETAFDCRTLKQFHDTQEFDQITNQSVYIQFGLDPPQSLQKQYTDCSTTNDLNTTKSSSDLNTNRTSTPTTTTTTQSECSEFLLLTQKLKNILTPIAAAEPKPSTSNQQRIDKKKNSKPNVGKHRRSFKMNSYQKNSSSDSLTTSTINSYSSSTDYNRSSTASYYEDIGGISSSSSSSSSLSSHNSSLGCSINHNLNINNNTKKIIEHNYTNTNHPTININNNVVSNKIHVLSPISDKSQEQTSELSDSVTTVRYNFNGGKLTATTTADSTNINNRQMKRKSPLQNKKVSSLLMLCNGPNGSGSGGGGNSGGDNEIHGSDSGISSSCLMQSHEQINKSHHHHHHHHHNSHPHDIVEANVKNDDKQYKMDNAENIIDDNEENIMKLPFDMPKLRRKRAVFDQSTSLTTTATTTTASGGSTTSICLQDLPFDMPKLRRRLKNPILTLPLKTSSSPSTIPIENHCGNGVPFRKNLTLNLCQNSTSSHQYKKSPKNSQTLCSTININAELEKQDWFHGFITRLEAESILRKLDEGSFLVRNSEFSPQDYTLSLKSAKGFMHIRIQKNAKDDCFTLGQFNCPFKTVPQLISHYYSNRLPIRGAEHMCLLQPVMEQLL